LPVVISGAGENRRRAKNITRNHEKGGQQRDSVWERRHLGGSERRFSTAGRGAAATNSKSKKQKGALRASGGCVSV